MSSCFIAEIYYSYPFSLEVENDRLRHIRLHERVNELPDPNYATLKYFLGHLHKYVSYKTVFNGHS